MAGHALRDFVELTKPRVVTMVLVTTLVGFYLGSSSTPDWWLLAATLLGTGLSAGGTLALNQYIERDADAQMVRTQSRPLPAGRLQPIDALVFGAALTAVRAAGADRCWSIRWRHGDGDDGGDLPRAATRR